MWVEKGTTVSKKQRNVRAYRFYLYNPTKLMLIDGIESQLLGVHLMLRYGKIELAQKK